MKRLYIDLGAALAVALVLSFPALGQISQEAHRAATVMGTVSDVNGDVIPNATVVLKEVEGSDPRTILTTENGMFEFHDVTPDITYQVVISAKDYEDWMSTPIILNPDQFKIVTGIQLRIATYRITVDVHYDPVKVATEQLKAEEKQRVFGVIPNFYVSYENDPGAQSVNRSSYCCGSVRCGQCQAGRRHSELWARLGIVWKAVGRNRHGWLL